MPKYAFNGSFESIRELNKEEIEYYRKFLVDTVERLILTKRDTISVNVNRIR